MTFMDSSPDNLTTSDFLLVQYAAQNHYHISQYVFSLVAYTNLKIVGLLNVWVTNILLVFLILLPFYLSTI